MEKSVKLVCETSKGVAKVVRVLKAKNDLTLEKLSEASDISHSCVNRIIAGSNFTVKTLEAIALAYKITTHEILMYASGYGCLESHSDTTIQLFKYQTEFDKASPEQQKEIIEYLNKKLSSDKIVK